MGLSSLLFKDPIAFILLVVPLLYSVILHEVSHGWVAYFFGDDTAKRTGRLSLSPLVHLDPIGTLALFLVGFGWAKPVPVVYSKLRNFRVGLICVSLAGCVTNIALATISILLLQFKVVTANPIITMVLVVMTKVNIILASFNLIPIPPLDGSRILYGILPEKAQGALVKIEPYGILIIFALLFTRMLDPIIISTQNAILTFIKLILSI
ncbi:MAG: site-2 protease family protein [Candidatus Omnitrophica bacterium]|nr:site-2 protease family protein [Candidatus Omnitrophota bacterium]MBU0881656.1 site-2 protease family protein [Candidatus Omnitrophota bacterium]MBU0895802.1 site-2 protease family protein [Candidatus Omnitrophota bacterium]MBU1038511.1 site-2 protease family protein [Candidatus Omnitrophota bacterium]MBU1808148.1 site-2 protease family protein [Candidatus Omnitrophota bacterium]